MLGGEELFLGNNNFLAHDKFKGGLSVFRQQFQQFLDAFVFGQQFKLPGNILLRS